MSVYTLASLNPQAQGQRPGGVATGHVPQQPNLGLGPNRYVPPTFNWGRGGLDGRQPNYSQMDWNQMQGFYMPQQQNNTFTNPYMQQLQGMLGMFSNQYGGPNRQPTLPQFSSYNPGFGGPTSFYDQSLQDWGRSAMGMQRNMGQGPQGQGDYQMYGGSGMQNPEGYSDRWSLAPSEMRGGGVGGGGGLPPGYSYDAPGDRSYTMEMPTNGGQWAYGPNGERIEVGGRQGPGADYFRNLFEGGGGGMQNPEGFVGNYGMSGDQIGGNSVNPIYANYRGSMGMRGGFGGRGGPWMPGNYGPEDQEFGGSIMPVGGGFGGRGGPWMPGNYGPEDQEFGGSIMPVGGGFGGRGGYPQMPQFNPYMLARNNLGGMDFNQMFDPRFAMLFGMGGLGSLRPQGFAATQPQQLPPTSNGEKPLAIGGGG